MTDSEENGDLVHEASTSEGSGESDTCADLPLQADDNDLRKRAKKLEIEGLLKIKFGSSRLSALEELLHDIYVVYRPSSAEYSQRGDLVCYYDAVAKVVFGKRKAFVEAYGSFLMDMFSHTSDLDLSINFSSDSIELPRAERIKALRKFSKWLYRLQSKGRISGVSPIMTARVPSLKFVECGTGIECDISVENKDGILKSHFVPVASEIDERFQKLSSLMKAWANAHGINSSKDGTLNSLSIILLVALHLQTRDPPILPPFSALLKDGTNPGSVKEVAKEYLQYGKENKESIAVLFTSLLSKLASIEVLWREGLCASAYEGSWISKKWDFKIGSISVEDFMDRSQNVARAVGREEAKAIYKCINSSLHQLSEFFEGRIEAPELKFLLFGAEPVPPAAEGTKIGKRTKQHKKMKLKKATLLNSVAKTESSQIEGLSFEGGVQTAAAIQNQSPESLSVGKISKKSKKKRSEKATPPDPVSKKKTRQTVAAQIPPEKLPYVIPNLGHGSPNQTLDTIQNHMPLMIAPIPPERPPFIVPGFGHEFHNFSNRIGFNEVGDPTQGPMFYGGGQWERHHTELIFENDPLAAPVLAEKSPFVISRIGHDFCKFPTEVREPVEYNEAWDLRRPMHLRINGGEHWGGHPAMYNHPHPVSAPTGYNGALDPTTNAGEQWGGHHAIKNHLHPVSAPIGYHGASDSRGPLYHTINSGDLWGGHQTGLMFQSQPHPISAPLRYNEALDFQHSPVFATRNVGGKYGGEQTGPIFHNHLHPISAPVGYNGALGFQHGPVSETNIGGAEYGGRQADLTFQDPLLPISAPVGHNGGLDSWHGSVSDTGNGGGQYGGQQTGPIVQNSQLPVSFPVGFKGSWIPQEGRYREVGIPQSDPISSTSDDAAKYRGDQAGHVVHNRPLPSSAPVGSNGAWCAQQGTVSASNDGGQSGGSQTPLYPDSSIPVACDGVWVSQRGPVSSNSNVSRHKAHEASPVAQNQPLPASAPIHPPMVPSGIPGIHKIPTGFTTNNGGHWHSLGS